MSSYTKKLNLDSLKEKIYSSEKDTLMFTDVLDGIQNLNTKKPLIVSSILKRRNICKEMMHVDRVYEYRVFKI